MIEPPPSLLLLTIYGIDISSTNVDILNTTVVTLNNASNNLTNLNSLFHAIYWNN